jgi:hypothetical protein
MSVPVYIFMYSDGTVWASNSSTPPTTTQEAGTFIAAIKFNSDLKLQKIFVAAGTVSSNLAITGGVQTLTGGISTQKELT